LLNLLWAVLFTGGLAAAENPALTFIDGQGAPSSKPLSELAQSLTAHDVSFSHPFLSGKRKTYRGYKLHDVLDLAFGKSWRTDVDYPEVVFTALDGYQSVAARDTLTATGGYIAFADVDQPGWEHVGRKKANPSPFFLIWTGTKQTTAEAFPWPWAIGKISRVRLEDKFPATVPRGAKKGSTVRKGYATFKAQCLRCHAIDQEGGKIGPDLNAPRNILSYRKRHMVRAFIRHPSKYRYTNMPDHEHLSKQQIEELLDYLKFMGKKKKKDW
jgi:mono/diheme cytochrome c family protein